MPHKGLVPCLDKLWVEFDVIATGRDRTSDGWIGDAAHQAEVSDHNWDETGSVPIHDSDRVNEVHAIDVDDTLRAAFTMEAVVQFLLGRCRSGAEKRLRYIIYNRRIWSASFGWVQKTYTGASPHTEHAHFSASYIATLEASTATWGLIEKFGDDMSEQQAYDGSMRAMKEFFKVTAQPADKGGKPESKIGHDASSQGVPDTISGGTTYLWALVGKIGALTKVISEKLDVPISEVAAAVAQVDEQVLASLADAGRSDQEVADALRAALGDRAGAVGLLLAG